MKISLNWIQDYVTLKDDCSFEQLLEKITEATAEIEGVEDLSKDLERCVVGKITKLEPHPDADKLRVAQVDVGTESVQIVCGGKNLSEGMLVAVSLPGAFVRWHGEGEPVEVKKVKLRGVESTGMICASDEIGLEKMFPADDEGEIIDLTEVVEAAPGTELSEALGLQDKVLDIDNHAITHRPDLFSHVGMARELVALGVAEWKESSSTQKAEQVVGKEKLPVQISFADKGCSKNYYSTVIKGLSTKESPLWIKARLQAVGIRSINAIVDVTNLVMMELGQPCHAFDLRLVEGKDFTHRLSKQGEEVVTLDGEKRMLKDEVIIVESDKEIIDLCGIMGGENSGIKEDTTDIYFHCCHYDNVLIRRAMIDLGHRTDAGTIFEKNIEPERSEQGFVRALNLFKEVFPEAQASFELYHYQEGSSEERTVELSQEKMSRYLGIEIPEAKVQSILEDLGFDVKISEGVVSAKVPTFRSNGVNIPEDLIEEVARIYGFSNIPSQPPYIELMTPEKNHKMALRRTLQKILTAHGFLEEVNFSFLSQELLEQAQQFSPEQLVEITNPVTEDFQFMRPSLMASMVSNLSRNQIYKRQHWKTFEMGSIFSKAGQEVFQHQQLLMLSASEGPQHFANTKQLVQDMMKELSLEVSFVEASIDEAYPGRCLEIQLEDKSLGHVFQLHPMIAEQAKVKGVVMLAAIDLDKLVEAEQKEVLYKQINRHPVALLDMNVVVDAERKAGEFKAVIESVQSEYLSSVDLVDVYEGESLGEGKKSFTYSLRYQHPERTLEEQEIQNIVDSLISALEKNGGMVRR